MDTRRLSILSAKEVDNMYSLPRFIDDDRQVYFELSPAENEVVEDIRTFSVGAYLILQLGYFKAKQQFFSFEQEDVLPDLRYIINLHYPESSWADFKFPSRPIRDEQQKSILDLFDYRLCSGEIKSELESKAERIAMLSTQPVYIFRELMQYLSQGRVVAPGYRFMQEMIGRVVANEKRRITSLLSNMITPEIESRLVKMLQADEKMYRVSTLKCEPKDFSNKELRQEVDRRNFLQPLYEFTMRFLDAAEISVESGKYYASLVMFYTVYKLQRMPDTTTWLYLLCYAFHRFRQINDNIIEAFIHLVNDYEKFAKQAAEQAVQLATTEASENLKAAGLILKLFVDNSIANDTPFIQVKERAFSILEPDNFPLVADFMRNIAFDKTRFEWKNYSQLSNKFKRNLRHLFCCISFEGRLEDVPLLDAVDFLQNVLKQGNSPRQTDHSLFPTAVIPKSLIGYLFDTSEGTQNEMVLNVDLYEFLIYRLSRNALEAGDVFVQDSTEFRRFEDDLIKDDRWEDKEAVLQEIGLPVLLSPIKDTLLTLRNTLEEKYIQVNQRISNGLNKHIVIKGVDEKRQWRLLYPDDEDEINHPFYNQLPGIGIIDLLWFVVEKTGFLDSFTHALDRYVKQDLDPREVLACIVAMGSNMGLGHMAEVSGITHASLLSTTRNYMRLETLHAANDVICDAIAALPIFPFYNIDDTIHSSSDGQHLETQIDTINARHSPKYFGLEKGVSAYTLVANHIPINAKIIGAHEHESRYVFDILYNNTSEIKPTQHSTDTHGTNQVNFWILYAFGYRFAPRYRGLHKKTDSLVGFQHPSHYKDCIIHPSRKANEELIEKEWPNVQRILASLAQKDITQSTIIRKLSSYARQNQTKKALWELENICQSIYILDYIDDVTLRQCVQKALNRIEAYHRFRRAIAFVNGGKFRVKTEAEQQLWNECTRLIANAIIYYNTVLLSKVFEEKIKANDKEALMVLKGISPVAWQHVNLFGTFEFNQSHSNVDIDALTAHFDEEFWKTVLKDPDNKDDSR